MQNKDFTIQQQFDQGLDDRGWNDMFNPPTVGNAYDPNQKN